MARDRYYDVAMRVHGLRGDITKVIVSYGVNKLPTAHINMAPGEPAGRAPRPHIPNKGQVVRIVATPGGHIFTGYVSGVSTMHTSGSTGISIVCHHFSTDLAAGPTLGSFSPIASFDFQTAIGFSSYRNITHYENALAQILATGDLVAAIRNVLSLFSGFPYIDVSKAQAVLTDNLRGELVFKAPIDARATARAMLGTIMTVFNGGTYWHALIAMADMFKFVVVPTSSAVYLFPAAKGLDASLETLYRGELVTGAPSIASHPGVRSIIVKGGPEFPISTYDTYGMTRPIFVADTVADEGQVEVVKFPAWLIPMKILNARDASVEVLARHFTSTSLLTRNIPVDTQDAAVRWGRTVVFDNLYQDNTVRIGTPLERVTDLIPGVNVRVQLPGVTSRDRSTFFTGFLDELSIVYDAVGHSTVRELSLTHVHEKFTTTVTADEHPLLDGLNPSSIGL